MPWHTDISKHKHAIYRSSEGSTKPYSPSHFYSEKRENSIMKRVGNLLKLDKSVPFFFLSWCISKLCEIPTISLSCDFSSIALYQAAWVGTCFLHVHHSWSFLSGGKIPLHHTHFTSKPCGWIESPQTSNVLKALKCTYLSVQWHSLYPVIFLQKLSRLSESLPTLQSTGELDNRCWKPYLRSISFKEMLPPHTDFYHSYAL